MNTHASKKFNAFMEGMKETLTYTVVTPENKNSEVENAFLRYMEMRYPNRCPNRCPSSDRNNVPSL